MLGQERHSKDAGCHRDELNRGYSSASVVHNEPVSSDETKPKKIIKCNIYR